MNHEVSQLGNTKHANPSLGPSSNAVCAVSEPEELPAREPVETLGPVEVPEPGVVDVPEPDTVEVPERA